MYIFSTSVYLLPVDCLQSSFNFKIRLVISARAIANLDVKLGNGSRACKENCSQYILPVIYEKRVIALIGRGNTESCVVIACVASVSVQCRGKERRTSVVVTVTQEYPTEPLDKIPALQAEFELAGKKKPWQISWLGNLNERLASWKYENSCRFWLDKKVYFFSWQSHCNFLYGY